MFPQRKVSVWDHLPAAFRACRSLGVCGFDDGEKLADDHLRFLTSFSVFGLIAVFFTCKHECFHHLIRLYRSLRQNQY